MISSLLPRKLCLKLDISPLIQMDINISPILYLLEGTGPASPNTAKATEELAVASMKKYNSSVGLAVLGEAGPVPLSKYKIGEIFISICINGETSNFTHNLRGNREDIINRAVNNCIWDLLNLIK